MNVIDYGKIISKDEVNILLNSIEKIHKINQVDSKWFPYGNVPKNNIEKYILESYSKILIENKFVNVMGFEWWIHDSKSISDISFHFDCDEYARCNSNKIITPTLSTITYLTDNLSPTVITNIKTVGEDLDQYYPDCPTELVYSFPGVGKFIAFDSKFYHGVLNTDPVNRTTLLYNVWSYCPDDLIKIGVFEKLAKLNITKNKYKNIEIYEGSIDFYRCQIFDDEFFLSYPKEVKFYDTFRIN
jgi:hypothetical protein